MTALSNVSSATAAAATEADVKNYLTSLYDYLNSLFGVDGTAATAKSKLDISFPKGIQVFTGSGNFTVPAGVTTVYVTGIGGGGPGGSSTSSLGSDGGGGGSGDQCYRTPVTVTPGQVLAVTVAAASGTTSFGASISLVGGSAGLSGSVGGDGGGLYGTGGGSRFGGVGLFGRGAAKALSGYGVSGLAAKANTGAGGNGANSGSGGGSGGAGASGILIVEW